MENFSRFGDTLNNAFYFVIDKIIEIQGFFIREALNLGSVVLLIAILSAGLNYALTGQGLKENFIKIMKATVFFLIVAFAYPSIIGFITTWTFSMAQRSVYEPVKTHFSQIVDTVRGHSIVVYTGDRYANLSADDGRSIVVNTGRSSYRTMQSKEILEYIKRDKDNLLDGMAVGRSSPVNHRGKNLAHTVVAPASVFKILFLIAKDCFDFSQKDSNAGMSNINFTNIFSGLICGFFIIFTGAFALLEYIICFLEFMLVASVGVILFPLSIWEGSKFAAEKFIGAIMGFFVKLLLCNIAIFLLIYGYVSLFYIISEQGFQGGVDQIIFIIFTGLLFFYICKSAPAIAQSLLTGTPSLSGTGAISAAGGAIAAAAGAVHMTQKVAGKAASLGVSAAGGAAKAVGSAVVAGKAIGKAGGNAAQIAGAALGAGISSGAKSALKTTGAAALGLTRSLLGQNFNNTLTNAPGNIASGASSNGNKSANLSKKLFNIP